MTVFVIKLITLAPWVIDSKTSFLANIWILRQKVFKIDQKFIIIYKAHLEGNIEETMEKLTPYIDGFMKEITAIKDLTPAEQV